MGRSNSNDYPVGSLVVMWLFSLKEIVEELWELFFYWKEGWLIQWLSPGRAIDVFRILSFTVLLNGNAAGMDQASQRVLLAIVALTRWFNVLYMLRGTSSKAARIVKIWIVLTHNDRL